MDAPPVRASVIQTDYASRLTIFVRSRRLKLPKNARICASAGGADAARQTQTVDLLHEFGREFDKSRDRHCIFAGIRSIVVACA